ncbi:uncharacterized protein V1513DRAFT_442783 [Lipomyces chichibuensis]|uniref:uncharacterized protein n=1 Tax=Lipomyces chichibuensis TaxID=1546026 RepID=UPI003343B252
MSASLTVNLAGTNHKMLPPGVILVFCIVGVVGIGLFSLFVYRKVDARRKLRQAY